MQSGRERTTHVKRGPMSQLSTGLQDEVSMASEMLVSALTPNEVVRDAQQDSKGQLDSGGRGSSKITPRAQRNQTQAMFGF